MSSPPFRSVFCAVLATSLIAPGMAVAKSNGNYLTWNNKAPVAPATDTPPATVQSGGQAYPVPPSPYGQVGDPFARSLNWPAKGAQKPAQLATVAPPPRQPEPIAVPIAPTPIVPRPPVASITTPVPLPPAEEVRVEDPYAQYEEPVNAPVSPPEPKPVPRVVAQRPVAAKPAAPARSAPTKAPEKAVAEAAQPAPALSADGAYQVPATSKYAAQINAARAAQNKAQNKTQDKTQDKVEQASAETKPAAKAPARPVKSVTGEATAPEPSDQMATLETDHVFIPGEQYKNAGDAPRLYSLHRAYGLTPDPITVTPNATGAILEAADLHADEGARDGETEKSTSQAKPEGK